MRLGWYVAVQQRLRIGLASLVVVAAMAGGVPGASAAQPVPAGTQAGALAGTPTEVATLPAPQLAPFRGENVVAAGATGFLHLEQGLQGYVWTDYATGTDTPQPELTGLGSTFMVLPAGGDHLVYVSNGKRMVGDPETGNWVNYQLSGAQPFGYGLDGTRSVTIQAGALGLYQLNPDGSTAQVPISGLPAAADYNALSATVDQGTGAYALVSVVSGGTGQRFLLDLASGVAAPVPAGFPTMNLTLSGGQLYSYTQADGTMTVSSMAVADVMAGTATVQQATVPLPGSLAGLAVVGSQLLLAVDLTPSVSGSLNSLYSVPLATGGTPALLEDQLVPQASRYPLFVVGSGGVLVVGGTSTERSVQRFTAAPDGSLSTTLVRQLPPPAATTATLTMDYGQVRQLLEVPQLNAPTRFALSTTPLAAASATSTLGTGPAGWGYLSRTPGPCDVGAECVRMVDGSWYGDTEVVPSVNVATAYAGGVQYTFPSPDTRIVDADSEFEVVDSGSQQYVWEPGQDAVTTPVPVTGAALWQGTLWRTSGPGRIQAIAEQDGLRSAPVVRTISTGVACAPSEIQVAQHWLYWSCGTSGPAGVYDLATNKEMTIPSGPLLLGDGYVVRHDPASGELLLTDVHTDSVGATTTLATFAAGFTGDDRDIDWTVDRTTGDVAYADASNTVHVLTTGVPASAVTGVGGQSMDVITPPNTGESTWTVGATVSRPVSSWRLVVSRASTGQQVHVATGGPTPAELSSGWNGFTDTGQRVYNGRYNWTVWATPADDPTGPAYQVLSGTVLLQGGLDPFHSYDENGTPTLFGITGRDIPQYPAGSGFVFQGNGQGGLVNEGFYSSWLLGNGANQVNDVVLFGDLDSSGVNGVLVRTGNGVLKYYPGIANWPSFNSSKPMTIGPGWNAYNQLIAVGDLNGDGHDDLVARDRSGVLWFFAGNSRGFSAPVRISAGWNAYSWIVAVGDVNGDGAGDIVAMDSRGILWRYLGNGHGGFGARTEVGSGFGGYTAVVGVGDLGGDGRSDIVARDSSGVLWRYESTASGTFPTRVRIGGGWNIFAGLY